MKIVDFRNSAEVKLLGFMAFVALEWVCLLIWIITNDGTRSISRTMNITKEWLETCGTLSLEGALFKEGIMEPQLVTLSFEQARPEPDVILMPDYTPACLISSILNMMQKGYTFSIQTHQKGCR